MSEINTYRPLTQKESVFAELVARTGDIEMARTKAGIYYKTATQLLEDDRIARVVEMTQDRIAGYSLKAAMVDIDYQLATLHDVNKIYLDDPQSHKDNGISAKDVIQSVAAINMIVGGGKRSDGVVIDQEMDDSEPKAIIKDEFQKEY